MSQIRGDARKTLDLLRLRADTPGTKNRNHLNNAGAAVILIILCMASHTPMLGDARQMAIVTVTGVIQLAIPYALFQMALKRVEPVDASLLILLEPVLNPIWVALVFPERPDWPTVVGGAAILAAMVIEALKPELNDDESSGDNSLITQ